MDSYEGQPLYVTVRGITGCDEVLESTSNGFVIDSSPPSLGILRTGEQAIEQAQSMGETGSPIVHQEYQTTSSYSAIWEAGDEQSGVSRETLKLGTYPGGGDLESEAAVSDNYVRDSIQSAVGLPNYVTLTAENEAGLVTRVTSEPIVLDTTPPTVGEVSSTTQLYNHWLTSLLIFCIVSLYLSLNVHLDWQVITSHSFHAVDLCVTRLP